MGLSVALLTSIATSTDAGTYDTPSISPTAARLYVAQVGVARSSSTVVPTLAGAGLAWINIQTVVTGSKRVTTFIGTGTPSSGILTATASNSIGCEVSVFEIDGVDFTDHSSGALPLGVRQVFSNSGTGTTGTCPVNPLLNTNSGVFAVFRHDANEGTTPKSGFTELHDLPHAAPAVGFETEWAVNDPSPDATWATSTAWLGIAFEVVALVAPGQHRMLAVF